MKQTLLLILLISCSLVVKAQTVDDFAAGKLNGVWWDNNNILNDPNLEAPSLTPGQIKSAYPPTRGVFSTVTWNTLEPNPGVFNWTAFDATLKSFADEGFYIIVMVWTGSDCPGWLYDPPYNVPKVRTDDPDHDVFPYYFNSSYKLLWYRMLDSVANHINNYKNVNDYKGNKLRNKIAIYQSAEGTTGDEGPYQGKFKKNNDDSVKFNRTDPRWIAFRQAAWKHLDTLYRLNMTGSKIHLLVNCDPDDPEDSAQWLQTNVPFVWRKANTAGHAYQLNGEVQKKALFYPLIDSIFRSVNDSVTYIRCRDEQDQFGNPLRAAAPRWFIYWTALSALHFGLDIWPNTGAGLGDTATNKFAYDFFTRYAGIKNAKYAPGAFCALRNGLDAADSVRFPTSIYGSGTDDTKDTMGMIRCYNIAISDSVYGAGQDDPVHAQGGSVNQLRAMGLNDVGWNIFPGNYERYLYQYINYTDTIDNGIGYWRVGDTSQPYGRFAKGFAHSKLIDTMFFNIDDSLFSVFPLNASQTVYLRVVYFDIGTGSWQIEYDALLNKNKALPTVTNQNSGIWKEIVYTIKDGRFANRQTHGSDFKIVNLDGKQKAFHMVEILKNSPP